MKKPLEPVNLEPFKEQLKIVWEGKDSHGNEFESIGKLNAGCWIGEHSGCLIREIEALREIEAAARNFINILGHLSDDVDDEKQALKEALSKIKPTPRKDTK